MLEHYPPDIALLLQAPMERMRKMASRAIVDQAVAARVDTSAVVKTTAVRRSSNDDWGGAGPSATAAQFAEFKADLERSGLVTLATPGVANNCLYRSLLYQVFGYSLEYGDETAAAWAAQWRRMVVEYLELMTAAELAKGPAAHVWVAAMAGVAPRGAGQQAGVDVVAAHLAAVRGGAQSTNVEVGALVALLDLDNNGIALQVHSSEYRHSGYCSTLTATGAEEARRVLHIAHVPAAGAGVLNHFEVLVACEEGEGGEQGEGEQSTPPPPTKKHRL